MKHIFLIAGALALGVAGPALAKPGNGHGNGHGHGNAYGYSVENQGFGQGYGVGGCPPGLAKKAVPCVPPGQAKKLYNVGQRFRTGAANPYAYNQIPYDLRNQYGLNPYNNYYYNNGYLYGVDPRTMVVQQAIAALLR
jgi:hypothetical protein